MQFNVDNRSSIPNIQRTIDELSKMFKRRKKTESSRPNPRRPAIKTTVVKSLALVDTPFIIQSRDGFPIQPAPYFEGVSIEFVRKLDSLKRLHENFMFVIIANNFVPNSSTFQSHMFVGLWMGGVENIMYIIDPNGNGVHLNNIYSGRQFAFPRIGDLVNPLYNTISAILKPQGYHLRFYTGAPIICPRGSPANCTYRSVMIMIGLMASDMLDLKEALEYANYLAVEQFTKVKTLSMKAFTSEANTEQFFKNFVQTLQRKNIQNSFFSV